MIRNILKVEGLALLVASVYFYFAHADGGWIMFAVLLLAPDVSLLGFVTEDNRIGAVIYNAVHNYVLVAGLIVIGAALDSSLAVQLGLILAAHVSMDRAIGYGLKYTTHFKHTHLQAV